VLGAFVQTLVVEELDLAEPQRREAVVRQAACGT
jgi:Zn-dependent alcohol dehydrogenase